MDLSSQKCRTKPRSLRIGYFNADGISTQRREIGEFVREHQLDVFLVQETFLKPSMRDPKISNYNLVRNDRTTSRLGGTLIYYKRSLHCVPIDPPALTYIEASICRLGMTGHAPITLVSAYLSPTHPRILTRSDLEALMGLGGSVILAGDLNAKNTSWNCLSTTSRGTLLESLSDPLGFDIIAPLNPTHYPRNPDHRPDILDIVLLKNITLRLCSLEVLHELDSDHRPVIVSFAPRNGTSSSQNSQPQTKKVTDWSRLEKALNSISSPQLDDIPDDFSSLDDANRALCSLTNHVQTVVNESSREVPVGIDPRWKLPDDVRKLLTEKNAAVRAYDSYPSRENKSNMNSLQRRVKQAMYDLTNSGWDTLLEGLEPSHQAFWRLSSSMKAGTVAPMPPLNRPNQPPAFDDEEKAECLADSLEAQCTPSTLPVDPDHLREVDSEVERRAALPPTDPPLTPVTLDELQLAVRSLKPKKAPGLDGISNRVIKLFSAPLLALLATIFNAALANCVFPQQWKDAVVIGIRKPGKPATEPSSYRPISLLNSLGKLYERIVFARLLDYVNTNHIIPDEQFGFRARHSCVQQVHRLTEHILSRFHQARPMPTGCLFFDVAKAFDKVWHNGLIYKLYSLGVPDRLVHIIRDYLSNRTFRYRVEGALSSPHPIRAGVPQGSVLSPLLFSLYTSDIPRSPPTQLALFADDTALYCSTRSHRLLTKFLQRAANSLGDWFRKWRIEVNPEKSTAVYFTRGRKKPPPPITLFGKPIPWAKQAKYLGYILDSGLTCRAHIKSVRDRAAFVLGRLHPLLNKRSKLSLRNKVRLYLTCIRPIMTYASVVFAHAAPTHIRRLQVIQNRFMRKATGAPWFVRNENLHIDLGIPTIASFLKECSRRYFDNAPHHPNPLVVQSADYVPLRDPTVRRRRPRNVLADPDDAITLAIQAAMESRSQLHSTQPRYRPRRRGRGSPPLNANSRNRPLPGRLSQIVSSPDSALGRGPCPTGRP